MRITIILVAPARAENIGAAARAMKTMGFSELRIVDSQAHSSQPPVGSHMDLVILLIILKFSRHWLNRYTMSISLLPPLRAVGRNIITTLRQ